MDDKPRHQMHYQPGLEVVHHTEAPQLSSDLDQDKELVTHTSHYAKPYELPGHDRPVPAPAPWWKRRRFIIAVAVVVIVALAATLGAVVGGKQGSESQAATGETGSGKGSSGGNGTGTGTSVGPAGSPPQPVRAGSPLAATAMRKSDGGLGMRLFFLDRDNHLVSARCDTTRALGDKESCWEMEGNFSSFSEADSQIAATNIVWTRLTVVQPQSELFYTGSGTRLLGVNFNDNTNPRIISDSIDDKQWSTGAVSCLAAYWPWAVYQDAGGALVHIRNNPTEAVIPDTFWGDSRINVTAMVGSKLAMVPVSTNYTRIADRGGYAVFYQGLDSRLSVAVTHLSELGSTYPLSFPITLPVVDLPSKASIAAFSAARPGDADQRVDAYVLYIDSSNNIKMVYTESANGQVIWRMAQPAALRGVDGGTSVACVTMATSGNDERGNVVPLEPVSDGNACYFQKGGVLMEAKMKSPSEWSVQSVVIAKV